MQWWDKQTSEVAEWMYHALLKPKYLRIIVSFIVKQALTSFFHICKRYKELLQFQQEGDSAKKKFFVLFLVLGQPYHQAP